MTSPVRVMHVITRMVHGGAQRILLDIVKGLSTRRFETVLVAGEETEGEGSLWQEAERLQVPIHRVPDLVRNVSPLRDWKAFRALRLLIRCHRPHVVHSHTSKAGLLGSAAARREGVDGVILAPHGHILAENAQIPGVPDRGLRRWLLKNASRLSSHCADYVIAPNDVEREDGIRLGVWKEERSLTVPNGIDTHRYIPRDREGVVRSLGWRPGVRRLGVVARLTSEKGVDVAIRSLPQLAQVELVIVGDGPERTRLEHLSRVLAVDDRVSFYGFCSRVERLLPAFEVCLVPSRTEAHGMVAAEALACGIPVIASRVGGLRSLVVPEETGLLVAPDRVSELAHATRRLLADSDLARRLGGAGRRLVQERFSRDVMLENITRLYERIAERTSTRD